MRRVPSPTSAALLATALVVGCGPRSPAGLQVAAPLAPLMAGQTWGRFRTLSAVHRVTIEVGDHGGGGRRALRGVIAVERPGRLRLRALGPGGVTLFDLLYRDGHATVLRSLVDPRGEAMGRLLPSITADLAAAYDLQPRPSGRRLLQAGAELFIEEPGRRVHLRDFRDTGRGPAPARMRIEAGPQASPSYLVEIEVESTTLDPELDPALFAAPPPEAGEAEAAATGPAN